VDPADVGEDAGSRPAREPGPQVPPLGAGVLQNLLGKSSQIVTSILLAAILVRFLGMGPYGIWALVQFLVGTSMLLDLGLAGYVEWAVATDLASGTRGRASAALKLALLGSGVLSLFLAAGLALFRGPLVDWLSHDIERADAQALLGVLPPAFFVGTLSLIVGAGVSGTLRLKALNLNRSLSAVSRLLVLLVAAVIGVRSIAALVALFALVTGLWALPMWADLRRHLGQLRPGRAVSVRTEWRRVVAFVGPTQGSNLALVCGEQGVRVVLAAFFGATAAGVYDLAYRISVLPRTLASVVYTTSIPYVASVPAAGRPAALARIYNRSLLLSCLLLIPGSVIVFALAEPLWLAWVGTGSPAGATLTRALLLMHLAGGWMAVDAMAARGLGRPASEMVATVVPYALATVVAASLGARLGAEGIVGVVVALNVVAAVLYHRDFRARFDLAASPDVVRGLRKVGVTFGLAAAADLVFSRVMSLDAAVPAGMLLLIRLQWYVVPAVWLLLRVPAYRKELAT
jgi:O-antigen/teichoic acid export membrane protein